MHCFSAASGMEAYHWGPPLAVVMRLLAGRRLQRALPKEVRGNTRPCFEGALTREAGAPSQNGRAPPPRGWWRKGESLW